MKVSAASLLYCPLNLVIRTIKFYGSAVVYRSTAGDKVVGQKGNDDCAIRVCPGRSFHASPLLEPLRKFHRPVIKDLLVGS